MNFFISSSLISYQQVSPEADRDISQLVIRTAQSKDLQSLAEILTKSFHPPNSLMWWMYPLLKLGIYEDLRSRLKEKSSRYVCLVASIPTSERDEQIVATVEVSLRSPSPFWSNNFQYPYISNLAVRNSYRRQGIARKLLRQCERVALEWGFQAIFLHVLENNERARQLYSTSGYELNRIEPDLGIFFWQSPKRLLLNKKMTKI